MKKIIFLIPGSRVDFEIRVGGYAEIISYELCLMKMQVAGCEFNFETASN